MMQGFNNSFITINNKFIGINLGSDFCAEHEWGIAGIRNSFDIGNKNNNKNKIKIFNQKIKDFFFSRKDSKYGLSKRKIYHCPDNLFWIENFKISSSKNRKFSGIHFYVSHDKPIEKLFVDYIDEKKSLATSWNENGFQIASDNIEEIKNIKELFDNFKKINVVVWSGTMPGLQNGGLCFGIADRLPLDWIEGWKKKDIEKESLLKDFEETGIEKKLATAGKKYFALRPERDWNKKNGSLIFWLNPIDQSKYSSGWFSIEELEQWAENKGPVIKQ